jgi:arylformamidase
MVGSVRIRNKTIIAEAHKRARPPVGPGRRVDLSHDVEDGMVTYRGLPAPIIRDYWTREESRRHFAPGTEFHIGRIEMVANTGTYVDSPFHRYPGGKDLAGLPLESLADLPAVVVRTAGRPGREIDVATLAPLDVRGRAVLLHTGWDVHWRTERYFDGHPFLTAEGAEWLVGHGAALVGIDSLNIDDTADPRRPAHSILLGHDVPVVEHLCGLDRLPDTGCRFFAVRARCAAWARFRSAPSPSSSAGGRLRDRPRPAGQAASPRPGGAVPRGTPGPCRGSSVAAAKSSAGPPGSWRSPCLTMGWRRSRVHPGPA